MITHTPGGDLDAGGSTPFDVYQGTYIVDNAPTIVSVTGTNGNVTVTWTNDAADATGLDVILYDQNGNVVEDDALAASATSDTFANVADGQGYTIDVVAHTPGGDLDSGPSLAFDLSNGSLSNDAAASVDTVTCTNGVITVSWTSNSPDATGYDVILYDQNGTVVQDDALAASATSDTFRAVADGSGYSVAVVAHTPFGDFTGDSWNFDIVNGSIVTVPIIDPVPGRAPIVVDPSTVTVTPIDAGAGGWTISWPELASAPTDGQYVVSDDQGDSCTATPTGVAGTTLSCVLAPRIDGTTTLTGLTVTFQWYMIEFAASAGSAPGNSTTPTTVVTSTHTPFPRPTVRSSSRRDHNDGDRRTGHLVEFAGSVPSRGWPDGGARGGPGGSGPPPPRPLTRIGWPGPDHPRWIGSADGHAVQEHRRDRGAHAHGGDPRVAGRQDRPHEKSVIEGHHHLE